MRNIHIIHASRSRPEQAKKTFEAWSKLLKKNDTYHMAIEPDQMMYYFDFPNWVVNSVTAIEAFNFASEQLGKTWKCNDIVVALSDDFNEPCDLELIREHCPQNGVLKTFDGIQNYIVTLPIMGVEYYESKGYIYPPQYKHMFADTHLTHEAELEGKLIIRNDIVIKHNHYSIGGCQKDALNERNDKTVNEGKEIYLSWVRQQTKQLTSKESESHRNWLRQNK
jgi:hypothetical protein